MSIDELIDTRLALLSLALKLGDQGWAKEIKLSLENLIETREFVERKRREYGK